MRTLLACVCLLISSFASGCEEKSDRITVYPVQGKVLVDGQPAAGARVVFYPTVEESDGIKMPTPAGTTDADGSFQLESYDTGDGAPAGDFKVTIVWPVPPPENADGIFDTKDRLNNRFSNPAKSGLTAMVGEGGGEIPAFEVK